MNVNILSLCTDPNVMGIGCSRYVDVRPLHWDREHGIRPLIFLNLSLAIPSLNYRTGQTCAHFGSLFVGSDIDGRQMRGKGTFLGMMDCMDLLMLFVRTQIPALGSFDLLVSTAWPRGSSTCLLWMSPNTLGEVATCSTPL